MVTEKHPNLRRNVVEKTHLLRHDAFVSCDVEDRIRVLKDLLPILKNASAESFEGDQREECLDLEVNAYDNPNHDNLSDYSPFIQNVMKMQASHCIIAVISRSYNRSTRCINELQIAKRLKKPIIPVIIDPESSVPQELREISPITFPDDRETLQEFYVKIIRSVKQHAGRIL